jgi:hypothetical protein
MKQFFFGLAACGLVAVLPAQAASVANAGVMATSNTDETVPAAAGDPSLCLDSMETVPDDDDLVPTPTSVDGGCSVSADTIST